MLLEVESKCIRYCFRCQMRLKIINQGHIKVKAFINLFNSTYSRLDFFCQTILKLYPANLTSRPYSRSSNSSSISSLSPGRVPLPFQWPCACVLYLPERLQAESQNDAGSHGRIAEHVAAPIGQRLTDGCFLHQSTYLML